MSREEGGSEETRDSDGHVSQVRNAFRVFEDYGMALQEQEREFSHHYGANRAERQQVGGDLRLSKGQQRMEDKYAAEYWEQVRRDREAEDERIAKALAQHLSLQVVVEEEEKRAEALRRDEELAKALADKEAAAPSLRLAKPPPPPVTSPAALDSDVWDDFRKARREGKPISLPPGITSELKASLLQAIHEEDERLAQEAQDAELARLLQSREKKRPVSREQADNDLNSVASFVQPSPVQSPSTNRTFESSVGQLVDLGSPPPSHPAPNQPGPSRRTPPSRPPPPNPPTPNRPMPTGGVRVLPP